MTEQETVVGSRVRLTQAHIDDLKRAGLYWPVSDLLLGTVKTRIHDAVYAVDFNGYERALHRSNFEAVK